MPDKRSLPAFVPYPDSKIRLQTAPNQWSNYLKSWIQLSELYLSLQNQDFSISDSLVQFCVSYLKSFGDLTSPSPPLDTSEAKLLHKQIYILCCRLLLDNKSHQSLLHWKFLSQFAQTYSHTSNISQILEKVCIAHTDSIELSLNQFKKGIVGLSESLLGRLSYEKALDLRSLSRLVKESAYIGNHLCLGSELLDSLAVLFLSSEPKVQDIITVFSFTILLSPARLLKPNFSTLSDHIFSLKSNASELQEKHQLSLLSAIVSNTNFISKLQAMSSNSSDSLDGSNSIPSAPRDLSVGLSVFRVKSTRQRGGKNTKSSSANNAANIFNEEMYIHRMDVVFRIQEVFPQFGSAFIAKLLDAYSDNESEVFEAIALENFPPHLANTDHSEQLPDNGVIHEKSHINHAPHSPIIPARKNIHDNDELDNLTVDTSKLHIGKANTNETADDLIAPGVSAAHKASILASLAAMDQDDDEHDDTYDAEDVGGTVDNTLDATDRSSVIPSAAQEIDIKLFSAWKTNRAVFERDVATRRSLARARLRMDTQWSDEQIEGWGIVLERDPKRQRIMEQRHLDSWRGNQRNLHRTAWQDGDNDDNDREQGDNPHFNRNNRGGGHSVRGQRPVGDVTGPAHDRSTKQARVRKSIGGSNMKQRGRDKKMSRGMS